eukprot:4686145-Amphidinium_carterae.1
MLWIGGRWRGPPAWCKEERDDEDKEETEGFADVVGVGAVVMTCKAQACRSMMSGCSCWGR